MKIVVVGAGAMGSLFGGTLASVADICLYDVNQIHVDGPPMFLIKSIR